MKGSPFQERHRRTATSVVVRQLRDVTRQRDALASQVESLRRALRRTERKRDAACRERDIISRERDDAVAQLVMLQVEERYS